MKVVPAESTDSRSGLRVLQVVTDRDRRGSQVYALDLAPGLQEVGCVVTTVALAPGEHGDSLPIEVLGSRRRSARTLWRLRGRARDHDIVVAHGSATLIACAVALAGTRTPFVYRQISDPLFWAATWRRRIRVAAYLRRAEHVVTLSSGVAAEFMRHYRLRANLVSVIPNAVPGERFAAPPSCDQQGVRERLQVPAGSRIALYVGALVEEKGVDLAIRSVADRDDVTLLVVGDGPHRSTLQSLGTDLMGDRIRFVGAVDDPRPLYWAADVLLMPTRGGDSMPAVLIESGLCGLPAVTCPVGAICDVVIDQRTGLVVPIDDLRALSLAVMRVLDEPGLAETLGKAAKAHCAGNFTIDATAPTWQRLLARLAPPTAGSQHPKGNGPSTQ